jgi:peptidyl-dipeptidase Dcp
MNILNKKFYNNFNTAPFSKINNEDFLPAIKEEIEKTRAEIDQITSNTEKPNFNNTIEALEFAGEQLDRITSIFFNLNSAETNDEIQKICP